MKRPRARWVQVPALWLHAAEQAGQRGLPWDFARNWSDVMTVNPDAGDERYLWLNRVVAIGGGRMLPGFKVPYRVYHMR